MLLHEFLEESLAPLLVFRDFLSRWRHRHSAHVPDCEGSWDINSQGKPFNVAVKFTRQNECALQRRVHQVMLFDRNENCPEAHGDLQFERRRPCATGGRKFLAVRARATGPDWRPRPLLPCKKPGKLDR